MIQRLTVAQASDKLGISQNAVRHKVRRELIDSEMVDGRRYVLFEDEPKPEPELAHPDEPIHASLDAPNGAVEERDGSRLIQRLEDENTYLRTIVDREMEAGQQLRFMLARRDDRIEQLESQLQLAPTIVTETTTQPDESDDAVEIEESEPDIRPWWRFW